MKALLAIALLSLLNLWTEAQVHQVNRFSFAPKQPTWTWLDLSGHFEQQSIELTKTGDLLAFSARRGGIWQFYRVRDWNTGNPTTDHLDLPGYFSSHDQHDLENLEVKIYVTPNSAYAVCVASAEWVHRVSGWAVGKARTTNIIKVIDLSTFKVVNSATTSAVDPYEFQSVQMDGRGRMLIMSDSFRANAHGEFIQLDIPSLRPGPKCEYRLDNNGNGNNERPIAITPELCQQDAGFSSLEEYFKGAYQIPPRSPGFTCRDVTAEYCPEPESFTADQQFGLGIRTEGHDSFFGSWVQTRATAILFSTRSRAEIGEIDLTDQPAELKLATVDSKDYLISIRAASDLTVYHLTDPSAPAAP
jgi:hypothetical protein